VLTQREPAQHVFLATLLARQTLKFATLLVACVLSQLDQLNPQLPLFASKQLTVPLELCLLSTQAQLKSIGVLKVWCDLSKTRVVAALAGPSAR